MHIAAKIMEHTEAGLEFDLPKNRSSIIKVIGVGGGGSNAVNHMKRMGINGVDFIVCNTDQQALEHSPVENQIQLGVNLTEGMGAGANPNIGRKAAEETLEEVRELLRGNTKMVFITAGMGGGTGTGAAPVIARCAKEMKILTVGIVTKPFKFEGKIREKQAQEGIEELRKHVDSLIVINNDKLREVYGNLSFRSGFAKADEVLATAAKGIAEVITYHFTTNIDLRDVRTVLENSGTAIMGSAAAGGSNRAKDVVEQALDSPLLNDNHIKGATNVLLLIVSSGGEHEITMDEMSVINEYIQTQAGGDTNVIMGIGIDDDLGEKIHVTVIATGFPANQHAALTGKEDARVVHPLEDDQAIETSVFEKSFNNIDTPEKPLRTKTENQPDLFSSFTPKETVIHTLDEADEPSAQTDIEQPTVAPVAASTNLTVVGVLEDHAIDESVEAQNEIDWIEEIIETESDEPVLEEEPFSESDMVADNTAAEFGVEEEDDFEIDEKIEISAVVEEYANEVVFEFDAKEATNLDMLWEEDDEEEVILNALEETRTIEVLEGEEDDLTFELDDIDGEGIYIAPPAGAAEPETEETSYDPFDMRIESALHGKIEETRKKEEIQAEKLNEPLTPKTTPEPETRIVHTLEDLRELEQKLQVTKPVQEEKPEIPKIAAQKAPPPKSEDMLNFEVKTKEPSTAKQEQVVDEDFLNRPLTPAAWQKIMERKSRLEAFNYTFKHAQSTMLEREPAYRRQGIEVETGNYSDKSAVGRMMLSGNADQTEIKTNNSFLHDNVD